MYDTKKTFVDIELEKKDFILEEDHKNKIPKGPYCYSGNNKCPYWGVDESKPKQMNGFCKLLNCNDWDHDEILWDQVKSCDINFDDEETE